MIFGKKINVVTLLADGTAKQRITKQHPDLPTYIETRDGSGRRYIVPHGSLFDPLPIGSVSSWKDLSDFEPSLSHQVVTRFDVVVSESNAVALSSKEYDDDQVSNMVRVAGTTGAQVAMSNVIDESNKTNWMVRGAGVMMGVCAVCILIMVVSTVIYIWGGGAATVNSPNNVPVLPSQVQIERPVLDYDSVTPFASEDSP